MVRAQLNKALLSVTALVAVGIVAACGSSSSSRSTPAAGGGNPAGGNTLTVPLTMATQPGGGGAQAVRALIHVRIGGGPSVPVLLDTGSPGLRVLPSVLGPSTKLTRTTVPITYDGGITFVGQRGFATVQIGSLSTRGPIGIQVFRQVHCPGHCTAKEALDGSFAASGAKGIMGIDTANLYGQNIYSPLLQLPAPYSQGFSLKLAPQGSGTLILGPPKTGPGTVTAPLMRSNPRFYRTGAAAYKRAVNMCWSAGSARACGVTDFDIGTPTPTFVAGALPGPPVGAFGGGTIIKPGTPLSVRVPNGPVVWSYTANTQYGSGLTEILRISGVGKAFITGIVPFYNHTIGWNMTTGKFVSSPG